MDSLSKGFRHFLRLDLAVFPLVAETKKAVLLKRGIELTLQGFIADTGNALLKLRNILDSFLSQLGSHVRQLLTSLVRNAFTLVGGRLPPHTFYTVCTVSPRVSIGYPAQQVELGSYVDPRVFIATAAEQATETTAKDRT